MRWSSIIVVFAVACSGGDEPRTPSPAAPDAPSVPREAAPSLVAPERIAVAATRATTVHVEVPNRTAIDSVIVIEATDVPAPVEVAQGVIGMTDTGTDIVVSVPSDMNPFPAYGRIELSLVTTRGVEATAEILVDVDGVPGTLVRIDSVALQRATAIHVDAEDRVVAVGAWNDQATVVRETARGGPDSKFGAFGARRIFPGDASSEASVAEAVASYPDGALVVGGTRGRSTFALPQPAPFVVRLRSDGSVDDAFAYAPREDARLGGVAVDVQDRAVVAFESRADASTIIDVVALSPTGAVVAETKLEASGTIVDVIGDAARRVHLALSDGTLLRLSPDLGIEATARIAPPFSAIVLRRSREDVLLRGGRIDGGEGFAAEETDVAVWTAIGAHSDGKIVAAGRDDFGSVRIARFWP